MDARSALILDLPLLLSAGSDERACDVLMGSLSLIKSISKSSNLAGSSHGELRSIGCKYCSPSMLSS